MDEQYNGHASRDDGEMPHRTPDEAMRGTPRSHEHPMVERSGRSRSTWAVLVAALIVAAAVYAAITLGIAGSG